LVSCRHLKKISSDFRLGMLNLCVYQTLALNTCTPVLHIERLLALT
jgi:hypothetical protein